MAAAALTTAPTADVEAACNLIPVASLTFPSTMGSTETPVTVPDKVVRLRVDPACDGSPGFEAAVASNVVTVQFQPPGGGATTDVVVDPGDVSVSDCTLPGGRCRGLDFTMPATTGLLPPYGLAGPARITVADLAMTTVAQIGDLFVPTSGCDRFPEKVFQRFTVLPPANNFAQLQAGTQTEVLATVDGSGALLVPLDYWGGGVDSVLAETPGAPVAIFLEGSANIPALGAGDPQTISQKLAAQPSPSDFVRSFTLDGRPLPPLLRVRTDGGLYGTADAVQSVLRIASNDGTGGPTLFNLTDRLTAGKGPIVIDTFVVGVNDPVPLKSLQSSEAAIAFARDEVRETVDLNIDADATDLVASVVDAQSGTQTNTGRAVVEIPSIGPFSSAAIVATGSLVAFLESETDQGGTDANGDGDTTDAILRVYDPTGLGLATGFDEDASMGRAVDGRSHSISGDKIVFRRPGLLVERNDTFGAPLTSLGRVLATLVSPDGSYVYASTPNPGGVLVYARNASTGRLTFVEAQQDGVAGVSGMETPTEMLFGPGATQLYVLGAGANAGIAVFDRDAVTGTLSFANSVLEADVPELSTPGGFALSPDGLHLYVANNSTPNATLIFDRDAVTGALAFKSLTLTGVPCATCNDITLSDDGLFAYLTDANNFQESLVTASRDVVTGQLTTLQVFKDGVGGVEGMKGPSMVVLSPDQRSVYVATEEDNAIVAFRRDTATGLLTFVEAEFSPFSIGTGIQGGGAVVHADGTRVFFLSYHDSAIYYYRRNAATSELTLFDRRVLAPVANNVGRWPAVAPDGAHLYAPLAAFLIGVDPTGVAVLRTDQALGVLDAATQSLRAEAPVATVAATAAERTVVLRPESETGGGTDLNGDGDTTDEVAGLYDTAGTSDVLVNLGVAAGAADVSNTVVAVAVRELAEGSGSTPPPDLNGDGDALDDVLATAAVGTPALLTNAGVSVVALDANGDDVALLTRESDEGPGGTGCSATAPPGGCDLNGDGDATDVVIRVYDAGGLTLRNIGQSARDFAHVGRYVAYRTFEGDEGPSGLGCGPTAPLGGCDLNGDGDALDHVMQVYDKVEAVVVNTERAATTCLLPGCDPTVPYKIKGDVISFLTDEQEQGADLNGDLDSDDIVLTVYNIIARSPDVLHTTIDDASTTGTPPTFELPPFPEKLIEGTILYMEMKESEVGLDVNADGMVTDDRVIMIAGDVDEDGAFDTVDDCVEHANADQSDLDADGLGTRCEPDEDVDGDGVVNLADNCPDQSNPLQEDADGDGVGDVCDSQPAAVPDTLVGVTATKLLIVDRTVAAGKAKAVFVAEDAAVTKGVGTDSAAIGSTLQITYDNGIDAASVGKFEATVGSPNWLVNKSTVAKYVNKTAPMGGGTKVSVIKPSKLVKLVGKSLGDTPIDILHQTNAATGVAKTAYCVDNGPDHNCFCSTFGTCAWKSIAAGTGAKLVCKTSTGDATCAALLP
jgi:6-phosphogluconolactonase (cycloisomerase 2 family)